MAPPTLTDPRPTRRGPHLRVLLLTDLFRPVIGGLELQVELTARELEARGHEVLVATLAASDDPADDAGVEVVRIRSWTQRVPGAIAERSHVFHPPAPEPATWWRLRALLRAFEPDVVHAHNWMGTSILGSLPASTALVVTMHEYGASCAKRTMVYAGVTDCTGPALAKCVRCSTAHYGLARGAPIVLAHRAAVPRLFRRADAVIAVSAAVRDRVAEWIPLDRSHVLPAFLAGPPPRSAERPSFVPPDGPYVLAVGALVPVKGMGILLESYRIAPPPAPLVLIGAARGAADHALPEGVTLVKDVPNTEVLRALQHAAVAVVPSLWGEPCPMTVLEALACGTPVVASAVGGIPDQLEHGAVGTLVPPGDAATLASEISAVLEDDERAARMREASRRRASRYFAATVVEEILDVYDQALSRRRAPAAIS